VAAYPELLIPEATENLYLPSGTLVGIPKAQPRFREWQGEFAGDTYGHKLGTRPAPGLLLSLTL
jgi:hypothetical protein